MRSDLTIARARLQRAADLIARSTPRLLDEGADELAAVVVILENLAAPARGAEADGFRDDLKRVNRTMREVGAALQGKLAQTSSGQVGYTAAGDAGLQACAPRFSLVEL